MSGAMIRRSEFHFKYPPNIHELDLATMVSMYRSRGEPRRAAPGKYLACTITHKLLREAKWWFGIYYSQKAWDQLLTKSSEGYPLTPAEMNALGLVLHSTHEDQNREYIEKNIGVIPKLAYLIINDLRQFGFLHEDEHGFLSVTPRGEKALQGICRRIYEKKFMPEMLAIHQSSSGYDHPPQPSPKSEQTSLF
jgi:hypothetical protein